MLGSVRRCSVISDKPRHQEGGPCTVPNCQLRQCKYLKTFKEQDHRCGKRGVNPGLGFGTVSTAPQTIQGAEARHMRRKGPLEGSARRDVLVQTQDINQPFGWVASRAFATPLLTLESVVATLPPRLTLPCGEGHRPVRLPVGHGLQPVSRYLCLG
jgi:hypothetical protein